MMSFLKIKSWSGCLLAVLLSLPLCFQGGAWAAEGQGSTQVVPDVDFNWAFVALPSPGQGEKRTPEPVKRDQSLKSGDQLKMMVELRKKCFVYIFHHNPQDGLKLLFPYTLQQFDLDYRINHRYYVPRSDSWFKLDGKTGQETFYLVASAKRLDELEQDYVRYESAGPEGRQSAAVSVLERIRALRREHRELALPAERPVPIGGAVRGVQPADDPRRVEIANLAEEVASTGFVARTYTIEHK